jgi:hypothetical protein
LPPPSPTHKQQNATTQVGHEIDAHRRFYEIDAHRNVPPLLDVVAAGGCLGLVFPYGGVSLDTMRARGADAAKPDGYVYNEHLALLTVDTTLSVVGQLEAMVRR